MSLGGMTALALHARWPPSSCGRSSSSTSRRASTSTRPAAILAFVNGPESFPSFDELLARTIEFNPTRSEASLRRGILHNAEQRDDGTLGVALRPPPHGRRRAPTSGLPTSASLWDVLSGYAGPGDAGAGHAPAVGGRATTTRPSWCAAGPTPGSSTSQEAGHSVQGDTPVELAGLIAEFVDTVAGTIR